MKKLNWATALATTVTFIVLSSAISSQAFAQSGQDRGGGRGVVCKRSTKVRQASRFDNGTIEYEAVTLLDYFEARQTTTLGIFLGPWQSYEGRIQFVINRLKKMDPVFAAVLEEDAKSFAANVAYVSDSELSKISDVTSSITPGLGCDEEQMAAGLLDPLPFQKKYLISKRLWDIADDETRAGLILHELIYNRARGWGDEKSDNARFYNALISSSAMDTLSAVDYVKILKRFGWPSQSWRVSNKNYFSFTWKGIVFDTYSNTEFSAAGAPTKAVVISQTQFQSVVGPITVVGQNVGFNDQGLLNFGTIASPQAFKFGAFNILFLRGSELHWNDQGEVTRAVLPEEGRISGTMMEDGRDYKPRGAWGMYGLTNCPDGKILDTYEMRGCKESKR